MKVNEELNKQIQLLTGDLKDIQNEKEKYMQENKQIVFLMKELEYSVVDKENLLNQNKSLEKEKSKL